MRKLVELDHNYDRYHHGGSRHAQDDRLHQAEGEKRSSLVRKLGLEASQ